MIRRSGEVQEPYQSLYQIIELVAQVNVWLCRPLNLLKPQEKEVAPTKTTKKMSFSRIFLNFLKDYKYRLVKINSLTDFVCVAANQCIVVTSGISGT